MGGWKPNTRFRRSAVGPRSRPSSVCPLRISTSPGLVDAGLPSMDGHRYRGCHEQTSEGNAESGSSSAVHPALFHGVALGGKWHRVHVGERLVVSEYTDKGGPAPDLWRCIEGKWLTTRQWTTERH